MKAFIIFRDRLTYAQDCFNALWSAGLDVVIVDQGSTWEPAVDWLHQLEQDGHEILWHHGGHPQHIWYWEPFLNMLGSDRYVVTDCDVIPSEDCPLDWPARLGSLLDEYPQYDKAGLGLRLDRIPETYQRRDHVLSWEKKFWETQLADGVYEAPVDTTMALYQPWTQRGTFTLSAVRTGPPYVADHVAWYEDYRVLTKELRWYHEHAEPGISYWTVEGRSAWGM